MKKSKLRPLWIALICLAAAAAVGLAVYCGFLLVMARYVPEDPNISVEYAPDTKLTVTWQGSEKAQSYSLAAQGPQGTETMECESNSAVLTRPAYGGTLKVRIKARRFFGVGTAGKTVDIGTIADVDVKLSELPAPTPAFSVTDGKNVVLAWDDDGTHSYRVAELNGEGEYVPIVQTKGGTADIRLGRDLDMPRFGRPAQICVRREEAGEGYTLYGGYSAPVTVKKEDVVGTDITLDYSAGESGVYTLEWSTSRGSRCVLQRWIAESRSWETLKEAKTGEEAEYTVPGALSPGSVRIYRAQAFEENSDEAVTAAETMIITPCSPVGAAVWPQKSLTLYADAGKKTKTGTASGGSAWKVEEESGGMFKITNGKTEGYVDSNYCLINLPDYTNELCAYDITNSYASLFRVHGYAIPTISGRVITGYENVKSADGKYLAPYLYPCAKKLAAAAGKTLEDGYRIKIYDSFRPYCATRYVYDTTEKILDEPALEKMERESMSGTKTSPTPAPSASPSATVPPDTPTYRKIMTNGSYSLGAFLARSGSNHNIGVALDMTLETADTGAELKMQTEMHDLSWYSSTYQNNSNAKLMARYMTAAGFGTLSSEWWHFEDVATKRALSLTINFNGGVSPYR